MDRLPGDSPVPWALRYCSFSRNESQHTCHSALHEVLLKPDLSVVASPRGWIRLVFAQKRLLSCP
eukprot:3810942-Prymnesium_polylepis.1